MRISSAPTRCHTSQQASRCDIPSASRISDSQWRTIRSASQTHGRNPGTRSPSTARARRSIAATLTHRESPRFVRVAGAAGSCSLPDRKRLHRQCGKLRSLRRLTSCPTSIGRVFISPAVERARARAFLRTSRLCANTAGTGRLRRRSFAAGDARSRRRQCLCRPYRVRCERRALKLSCRSTLAASSSASSIATARCTRVLAIADRPGIESPRLRVQRIGAPAGDVRTLKCDPH